MHTCYACFCCFLLLLLRFVVGVLLPAFFPFLIRLMMMRRRDDDDDDDDYICTHMQIEHIYGTYCNYRNTTTTATKATYTHTHTYTHIRTLHQNEPIYRKYRTIGGKHKQHQDRIEKQKKIIPAQLSIIRYTRNK